MEIFQQYVSDVVYVSWPFRETYYDKYDPSWLWN